MSDQIYLTFKKEMKRAYELVDQVLADFPIARNSDFALAWIVLRKHYPSLDLPDLSDEILLRMAGTITTLRRQRQVIQNVNKRYPPTEIHIMTRRKQRAENYRRWFGAQQGGDAYDRGDYDEWKLDEGIKHSLVYWRESNDGGL